MRGSLKLSDSTLDVDDVERVVFFNDIQYLLFNPTLLHTRSDILYAFLNFLGIPVNNFGSNDPVILDPLIHVETMLSPLFESNVYSSKTENEPIYRQRAMYEFPIRAFPLSTSTVFAMEKWFGILTRQGVESLEKWALGRIEFIR